MKIAMIAPYPLFRPDIRQSEDDRIDAFVKSRGPRGKAYSPSDSILQLAALTPTRHEIVYMDDQYGNVDAGGDFDLVAITAMTQAADRSYRLAREFRERGTHVVIGGTHPTLCPRDAAPHADTVVVGDADAVWGTFLRDFEAGKAKSRYDGGCADISGRPPPRIDMVPRGDFFRKAMQKEVYPLFTTIGCSRVCKFCSNWQKEGYGRLQKKPLERIRIELDRIAAYSDNYEILIMDDNLFLDPEHGKAVMKLIGGYGVKWSGPTDVSVVDDPEIPRLMKESGCRMITLGLESLREDNLTWLAPWKARQVRNYRSAISILRDNGINTVGSFMVALEHDTDSVFRKIFDFYMESGLLAAAISILTPYPGTLLRQRLLEEDRIDLEAPWEAYTAYNLLFDHPTLSKKEVYDGLLWFLQKCESSEVVEHLRKNIFR